MSYYKFPLEFVTQTSHLKTNVNLYNDLTIQKSYSEFNFINYSPYILVLLQNN